MARSLARKPDWDTYPAKRITFGRCAARAGFAAARKISARLAALSPGNADWKNDLAWIDEQIAELGK